MLKKYNIPIVYTAHDLKMLCPNYKMLTQGCICEKCKGDKYYNCVRNKCMKGSVLKSFVGTIEAYVNKWRNAYDKIDYIITPSKFYKEKFIEFGIEEKKVIHIPNFLNNDNIEYDKLEKKDYYLYFGRLSEEKGIMTLVDAFQKIKLKLKIVGTGPLKENIEKYINEKNLNNIEVLGFKNGKELNTILGNAKCVILPSEWYENGPYSAIEALKLGRPLIGSDLGGIPELIDDGVNGFIFKNKDVKNLKECILKMEKLDSINREKMSQRSYEKFLDNYTELIHFEKIYTLYTKIIKKEDADEKNRCRFNSI